jgi:hypothetical protein
MKGRLVGRKYFFLRGQSALEIIIAMAIIVISISTVILVIFTNQSVSVSSDLSNSALYKAEEQIENARAVARGNFNSLNSTSSIDGMFTKELIVSKVSTYQKKVTSRISWQTDVLHPQKIELVTYVTDWLNVPPPGSNCSAGPLSGNWAQPRILGSGDIGSVGSGNQGTGVAVAFPYAYVSGVASSASKPDIFVFDVSNSASPTLVSSLDVGSGGINSIFLKGNYLYAASPNDNKELIIFDVSIPTNIREVGSLNLSGSYDGLSVIAFGNTVALGRAGNSGKELYFINVTSPSSPSIISSYEVGDNVNGFALSNKYLYLVSKDADNDLWVFDITNPSSPSLVSTYNIRDGTEDITVGYQPPGTLFVGNLDNKIVPLDVSDPLNISTYSSFSTGGSVKGLFCVVDNLTFMATTNSTKEFMILNTANPRMISEYASLNFPQVASGIAFKNNLAYLSMRSNDALKIISSSP